MSFHFDDLDQSVVTYNNFDNLARHIGHNVVCVTYGGSLESAGPCVSIECEDCREVLFSHDRTHYNPPPCVPEV